jgi:hypothetical protein
MAKAVLSEGVGLARVLLTQAGARVRACTGAVRLVLIDSSASASKTTTVLVPPESLSLSHQGESRASKVAVSD